MSGITEIIEAEDKIEDKTDDVNVAEDEQVSTETQSPEGEQESKVEETPDADELVVSFGDEQPQDEEKAAPTWVKELRKANREKDRQIRELQAKIQGQAPSAPKLGKKPSLEDFDYDTDKFEEALTSWYDQKRQAEDIERREEEKRKQTEKAWTDRLENYAKAKTQLKANDYEDAEMAVQEVMSQTQQGIIVQGADNPALLVYALGKNPSKLKELSAITDPVAFAFAVAKLETQVKTTSRKNAPPPPERRISGTAPVSGAVDAVLDRLRAEAERTGNYTKVAEYKRTLREKR